MAGHSHAEPTGASVPDRAMRASTPAEVLAQASSCGVSIAPGRSEIRLHVPSHTAAQWTLQDIRVCDPPDWLTTGRVRLPMRRSQDVSLDGHCVAVFAADDTPAITRRAGDTFFAFDPVQSLSRILREAYRPPSRPLITRLPASIHWLPGWLRLWLHRQLLRPAVPQSGFPQWPQEPAVEALGWLLSIACGGKHMHMQRPWPLTWPEGKAFALIVMHDLDTASSYRAVQTIARLESRYGIRSCFNVVARGYEHDTRRLFELLDLGHEIGLHGDTHDPRLPFLDEATIRARLESCIPFMRQFHVQGLRSPFLYSSPALDKVLQDHVRWSSSSIDTDLPVAARFGRGVATVFPFRKGRVWEIPQTLPLDDRTLLLAAPGQRLVAPMLAKADYIRSVGGIAVIGNHLEPHLTGGGQLLSAYEEVLDGLATRQDVWTTVPRELVDFLNKNLYEAARQSAPRPRLAS